MSKMYVNEIASKTGATTGLTIDSSGRVLAPNKVAFKAGIASNFNPGTASRTKIPFVLSGLTGTSDRTFNHGNGFDAANNRFEAPVAGTYWFSAQCYLASHSASAYHILRFTGNNNAFVFGEGNDLSVPNSGSYDSKVITMIADLAVGDTVDVRTQSASDSSYVLETGNTAFMGYLIG
jgi:hypothetical protein